MGFQDRGDGGTAPYEPGLMGEMDLLRRKAAQAGQLTSLGAEPGMAQRWARVKHATDKYLEGYDQDLGYGDASVEGFTHDRNPLPIIGNTLEVPADRSAIAGMAEGIPGLENALSGSADPLRSDEEITVRPPAPKAPAFLGRFGEWVDEGGPEQGIREGGDRLVDMYDAIREEPPVTTPWWLREALERAPDLQRRGAAATGEPSLGQAPVAATPSDISAQPDLSSMSQAEFQRGIQQAQAGMRSPADRARERVAGDIASLPSIEDLQAKFGTREDLGRGLGREELPSGERRWTAPGVSISMRGTPDPKMEAQARAGLADRAFKPQTFDPAEMDVSQATLEHAMAQRAAQAQISGMESQARQQSAQADAAERDPLGIERYRAQQAIQDARFAAQNQGRLQTSLADDQFRAEQQNTRANRVNEIINSHLESKRALEAALAQAAPDSPEAAMRQQQLDSLREETEMTLAGLGVRLPSTGI